MSSGSAAVAGWWTELRACALVGTARRPVPQPIPLAGVATDVDRPHHTAEARLLDAAALGGAARRAGRLPSRGVTPPEPAPSDTRPAAPAQAVQLLELLLGSAPGVGAWRDGLLVHWLEQCEQAGRRLPPSMLEPVLARATGVTEIRAPALGPLGARGRWLAGRQVAWRWAADRQVEQAADASAWAHLAARDRVALLTTLRGRDPAAARALIEETWATDPASARAAHLETLATGLHLDDEALLDAALDDRARSVREVALRLLDGLPTSARGRRMAARLAPLLHVEGTRRSRVLTVALPDDPDPDGGRDGLTPAPARRSVRGWWVEQFAAAAPFEVWTDASGTDIDSTVALVTDADALAGLARAAIARGDTTWAAALHRRTGDPALLAAVAPDEREGLVADRLASTKNTGAAAALWMQVPGPWSVRFSRPVIDHLRRQESPLTGLQIGTEALATRLHPSTFALVEAWLGGLDGTPQLAAALRSLLQYHTFHRSITEAFVP